MYGTVTEYGAANWCITQLELVKGHIGKLKGSSFGAIITCLEEVIQETKQEKNSMNKMKEALEDSIHYYEQAERKIINNSISIDAVTNKEEKDNFQWEDILSNIGEYRGNEWEIFLEALSLKGILGNEVVESMEQILSGTYITSKRIGNITYFKLNQNGMTNSQIGRWLEDNIGGFWDDYRARNMKDYKFGIYNHETGSYTRKARYFDNITDSNLSKYIANIENSSFLKTMASEFKPFDDFNYKEFGNMTKLGKAGKVLGTAGTVLTIGCDVVDNFYDSSTGSWEFSGNKTADCVVDVAVDLSASAGSMAAGAAVGSLIAPPVGTVVGAGVGIAVDVIAKDVKLWDLDGDGKNDSLVDSAKIIGHGVVDAVEDIGNSVGNWLGGVFSF